MATDGESPGDDALRNYGTDTPDRVRRHYEQMHREQTVSWVRDTRRRFDPARGGHREEMSILEAVDRFAFVDASDPDFEADNLIHCYQTGEACRRRFPDLEWMHLVGFLHDLGKAPLARAGLPQWSIAGDIFPVGCAFDPSNVFADSFAGNPDAADDRYAGVDGIYTEGCGFETMHFAYGHDQYLFDVLSAHSACRIPKTGLYLLRFHSFYPWHAHAGYARFASRRDHERLPLLRRFQSCDLYSKMEDPPDPEPLRPYYSDLVDRYCPGVLRW